MPTINVMPQLFQKSVCCRLIFTICSLVGNPANLYIIKPPTTNKAINPIYIIRLLNSVDDERTQYAVKQIEDELIKKFKDTNERD